MANRDTRTVARLGRSTACPMPLSSGMGLSTPFNPTLVWCIASEGATDYLRMLRISVASAQVFHPELPKTCLVSASAVSSVESALKQLQRQFTRPVDVVSVNAMQEDPLLLSRYLKIHAYPLLAKDMIVLDVDTLFVDRLRLDRVSPEPVLAAANLDGHAGVRHSSESWIRSRFNQCNWHWSPHCIESYANTGVVAYRRSAMAAEFAAAWHSNWNHFRRMCGEHYDQCAFNHTASEMGCVGRLPIPWNSPVGALPQLARNAAIFHYYASGKASSTPYTLWGWLLSMDAASCLPDRDRLHRVLGRRQPFVSLGASPREYFHAGQWGLFMRSLPWLAPFRVLRGVASDAIKRRTGSPR